MISGRLLQEIELRLRQHPAAILLGPRQVGNATLARRVAASGAESLATLAV